MRPETRAQKQVLDAVNMICAETGRAATIKEVAERTGKGNSTVHAQVQHLIKQGLLRDGRGLQPVDARYEEGWKDGVTYLGREIGRVLAENHAGKTLIGAIELTVTGAKAITGETA